MNNIKKYSSIVLLIFLFLIKIQDSNFVKKVENISYDAYQSFFIEKSTFEDVVIIDIDEKSIGEIGQFPWRRDIFADLIQKLNQYGVSVITFDVFFPVNEIEICIWKFPKSLPQLVHPLVLKVCLHADT